MSVVCTKRTKLRKFKVKNSQKILEAIENQELDRLSAYLDKALLEDDPATLLELGQYFESIGFYPEAKQTYLHLKDDFPEVYLSLATIVAEDGLMEEAFAYLEEIPERYLASLLVKADLYQSEGLADVAREKLMEAASLSDDPIIQLGLAEIDLELENYQEAIQEYAQLDNRLILEETGISTYQRIGYAYANLGRFEAAIEFLEKALEIEFDDQIAYELATLLYDREEYQRALIYFKQIDTLSPDFEGYEYGYALALQAENDRETALAIAEQGIQKNPFDAYLLLLASQLAYELHEPEKAEKYLLEAKEVAEDLEEIALRLTTLYMEQERYEEVLAWQEVEVENVVTRWNIARALVALEEIEKAGPIYEELFPDLKNNPEFLESYSYLLRELGDIAKAREVAEGYLQLVPDDGQMQAFYESLLEE
mgnify:CR=1 FL=1